MLVPPTSTPMVMACFGMPSSVVLPEVSGFAWAQRRCALLFILSDPGDAVRVAASFKGRFEPFVHNHLGELDADHASPQR